LDLQTQPVPQGRLEIGRDEILENVQPSLRDSALVSAELFARIRSMRDRFDALSKRIAEASAEVPVEEGPAEIDTLVAQNRLAPLLRKQ
jgi:hypothetical protein